MRERKAAFLKDMPAMPFVKKACDKANSRTKEKQRKWREHGGHTYSETPEKSKGLWIERRCASVMLKRYSFISGEGQVGFRRRRTNPCKHLSPLPFPFSVAAHTTLLVKRQTSRVEKNKKEREGELKRWKMVHPMLVDHPQFCLR